MVKEDTAINKILQVLEKHGDWLSSGDIDKAASVDRPTYTSRLLSELSEAGRVIKKKDGRNIFYRLNPAVIFFEDNLNLITTDESGVFRAAQAAPHYRELIPDRVDTIAGFAFTEMLNNAKDHSKSGIAYAKIWEEEGVLKFIVEDKGIGVFRNIKTARRLHDETEAIQDLVKGKTTTAPRNHSGEGIFWTSKLSDKFTLSSYDHTLYVDNVAHDYAIQKNDERMADYIMGTKVQFEIATDSKKSIDEIFRKFSLDHETYSFTTTEIPLKLYSSGDFWVSRSQAKRVLAGLDKYKKIIIDFSGINLIGQGFADEIFRVFNIAHPEIILEPVNMNESVKMMVERARQDWTGR